MLKKTVWLGGLAFTLLMGGLILFASKSKKKDEAAKMESPDWFEYYREFKGLDRIDLPFDIKLQWHKQDLQNARLKSKGQNNLENIKEVGPYNIGGRTRSIVIDRNNLDHIVSGGVSGGLWYSNNEGADWTIASDQAPTLSVTSITQSPFDPDVYYYGSGETYNNTLNVNGLGIFKSVDGGESFALLESSTISNLSEIWDIEHSLVYDSTIYVGTDNGGLYRSTDAGESFDRIFATNGIIHEIRVFDDSTIMFALSNSGIYRMNENDLSTKKLGNGLPTTNFSRISFDFCRDYPEVIYAHFLTSDFRGFRGAYKSSDGGESWTQLASPNPQLIGYSQGWYDFIMRVSPTDSNFLVSGGIYPIASTNGGASWFSIANSHADYHEVTFYPDGQEFLIGNDGGIYRYRRSNLGTYTDLNFGYNVTQFYAGFYHPDNDDVIAGAQDNNTRYSIGANQSFGYYNYGDGSFCAIHQQDPSVVYVSSQYLNLRRKDAVYNTVNTYRNIGTYIRNQIGGNNNTWFINPFEMNLVDGDQLYVPTRAEVFRSLNQGNLWVELTADLPGSTYSIGMTQEQDPTLYIGGTGSQLHRLENAASNVKTEVSLFANTPIPFRGSTIGCIEVDPNNEGTIYCAMSNISPNPRIWRVRNADTDNPIFEDLQSNLPDMLAVSWIEVDPLDSNFIIIATDYGLYTSNNGGGWWEKENRIPNVAIDQIRLKESNRKLYIFTHGRGAWTADLADQPTASVERLETIDLKVYPNPSSTHFKVDINSLDKMHLYGFDGKQILSTDQSALDIRGIPNGTYFLEILHSEGRSVEKVQITGH